MVGVEVGASAPDFAACDPEGFKKVTLGDLKGKTAVISFFPAAFSGTLSRVFCVSDVSSLPVRFLF